MAKSRSGGITEPSVFALELLRAYVEQFGEEGTKSRALEQLKSPRGFQKWYQRHYGYPCDTDLFVVRKAREFDGVEKSLRLALNGAGLGGIPAIACKLDGLEEGVFNAHLSQILCPPVLVIAQQNHRGQLDVISLSEDGRWWFSKPLWKLLRFDRTWWLDDGH